MAAGDAGDEQGAVPATTPVTEYLADRLSGAGTPGRQRLAEYLRQLGVVDRAIYAAVAAAPTADLDGPIRGLSIGGGRNGRRAAAAGAVSIGVTSALVNLGVKPLYARQRPDRAGAGVPGQRYVHMPSSSSFPSGHSAAGFAFATAVGRELPWLGSGLRFAAAAVAYSRVHTGVHYPGDTVIGSLIGAGTGQAVAGLMDRSARKPVT